MEEGKPSSVLRLIEDGAGEAFFNMARDVEILHEVETGTSPPTLRLYSWEKAAITVGKFQDVARTLCLAECERLGVPVVQRPTGGRGILHGDDLTVSLCAPIEAIGFPKGASPSITAIYLRTSEIFQSAFEKLGVLAKIGEGTPPPVSNRYGDCFQIASSADLISVRTGQKILGSALLRRGDTFLQQVSIPLYTEGLHCTYFELGEVLFSGGSGLVREKNICSLSVSRLKSVLIEEAQSLFSTEMR